MIDALVRIFEKQINTASIGKQSYIEIISVILVNSKHCINK